MRWLDFVFPQLSVMKRIPIRTFLALSDPACEPEFRRFLENRLRTPQDREEAERFCQRIQNIADIKHEAEELDPNLIIDYLDYQLSAEDQEQFESRLLSSDAHLAELADVYSILTHSLGQPIQISSETRSRLYAVGQRKPEPQPVENAEKPGPITPLPTPIRSKRVQESLDEWKWERLNRIKNIVVAALFLIACVFVWTNQDAIDRFTKKFRGEDRTAGFTDSVPVEAEPTPSVLDSVLWNESQAESLLYTQLESPEAVQEKTDPKPLTTEMIPPLFLKKPTEIRPAAF